MNTRSRNSRMKLTENNICLSWILMRDGEIVHFASGQLSQWPTYQLLEIDSIVKTYNSVECQCFQVFLVWKTLPDHHYCFMYIRRKATKISRSYVNIVTNSFALKSCWASAYMMSTIVSKLYDSLTFAPTFAEIFHA